MKALPGVYPRGTIDYDAIEAVRHTHLKEMALSPKHYRCAVEHPRKDTPAFRWGRIVHTATLEPDLLTDEYVLREHGIVDHVLWEGGDRRGPAWKAFKAAHEGRTIVKPDEIADALEEKKRAIALAAVIHADPVAGPILANGHREGAVVWVDRETGILCKARFDNRCFLGAHGELSDLKTTRNIESRLFGRDAARLAYHQQLAFYADGVEAATGHRGPVSIIAVETDEPHDVVVYEVDEDTLAIGRDSYRHLLARLAECLRTNTWPGYAGGARMPLTLPRWVLPDEDEGIEDLGLEWTEQGQVTP